MTPAAFTRQFLSRRPATRWLAVAGLGLLLGGCAEEKPAPPPPGPMPVTVLEMQPQNVPARIEVMAQAEGAREAQVRARVSGVLVKRLYQEGDPIKAGQALFQIDRAPYENALAEARARAEQTAREAARLKGLAEAKAIAQKDYDDAASASAMAQAALKQAELNLSWTTVTAPVSGVAGRAEKSEGNLISSTDNLLTSIYQLNPIWARFALGESDLARFPGKRVSAQDVKTVELVLSDGSVYPKRGKLNFVASTVDPTLGAQQLRAEFDNAEQLILPGQFVRVRLVTGERQGVFLVPQTAVAQGEQGARVMTVGADNKAAPRPVQTGEWLGKDWVILGGLKAGDKVIIDNLIKLKPGMPVKPRAPGEAPAGGDKPAADGKKG